MPIYETADKITYPYLNEIWESFVLDVISHRMPNVDQIAGVRISDKSRGSDLMVRLEVWLKFPDGDTDARGIAIKDFVEKEYFEKRALVLKPD
jgi:hypothetical protein